MQNFNFSNTPKLYFGEKSFNEITKLILDYGNKILLVLGGSSFQKSVYYTELEKELKNNNILFYVENVKGEPSPNIIDEITQKYRGKGSGVLWIKILLESILRSKFNKIGLFGKKI